MQNGKHTTSLHTGDSSLQQVARIISAPSAFLNILLYFVSGLLFVPFLVLGMLCGEMFLVLIIHTKSCSALGSTVTFYYIIHHIWDLPFLERVWGTYIGVTLPRRQVRLTGLKSFSQLHDWARIWTMFSADHLQCVHLHEFDNFVKPS